MTIMDDDDTLAHRQLFAVAKPSIRERITAFRSSKRFIVFTISLAIFTDALLYGLVVPVIPTALKLRLGLPPDEAQSWTSLLLGIYSCTVLISSPILGWFADNHSSRRTPLLGGLIALALTTGALALANSITFFIVARILQALSATIVWTVGLALVVDTVGQDHVGEAMGFITMGSMGGVAISPTLGGIIYDRAGYYSVYYFALGFIFVDIVLRLLMLEQKDVREKRYRASRQATQNYGSIHGNGHTNGHASAHAPEVLIPPRAPNGYIGSDVAPLLANGVGEPDNIKPASGSMAKSSTWIPAPIRLLGFPRVLACMFCHMVTSGLLTAFDAVLPLHVKDAFGWNTGVQGVLFFVIFFPTLLSPLVGRLSDHYGPRWFVTMSYLAGAPTLYGLSWATSDVSGADKILVVLLFFLGLEISINETPILAEFDAAVQEIQLEHPDMFGEGGATAQIYSLSSCAFATGATLFPVAAGFIRNAYGWSPVMYSLAGCTIVAVVPAYLMIGGWIRSASRLKRKSRIREESPLASDESSEVSS